MPEAKKESTGNEADSGLSLPESLANYDRATSSWKTSQRSLFEEWAEFSATWPQSGMMLNGTCYRRPPLVHGISDAGFSLLPLNLIPTPVRYDATPGGPNNHYKGLGNLAKHGTIPTPTCSDAKTHGSDTVRFQSLDVFVRERTSATEAGGQLNPTWVEWLMGFPIGWTELPPSETP
jgi:hypothetical protein